MDRHHKGIALYAAFLAVLCFTLPAQSMLGAPKDYYRYSGAYPNNQNRNLTFFIGSERRFLLEDGEVWRDSELSFGGQTTNFGPDIEIHLCPSIIDEQEYICFLSDYYSFTYPRKRYRGEKSWTMKGGRYTIVEENISITIFGKTISGLMRIRSDTHTTKIGKYSDRIYETLYSPKIGIVGITAFNAASGQMIGETMWLNGEIGLAALPDDAEDSADKAD